MIAGNNTLKAQLGIVLASVVYFSIAGTGIAALYGGLVSFSNTILVNRHIHKQKNNTTISASTSVYMMIASVMMRMLLVTGLILIGMLILKLDSSALILSLILGLCGFLIDKVLDNNVSRK